MILKYSSKVDADDVGRSPKVTRGGAGYRTRAGAAAASVGKARGERDSRLQRRHGQTAPTSVCGVPPRAHALPVTVQQGMSASALATQSNRRLRQWRAVLSRAAVAMAMSQNTYIIYASGK